MWEELDHYETYQPKCQPDATSCKEKTERKRIFEFLAGLNDDFELVWINILSRGTLSSLNEVYALAETEESWKYVMHHYSFGTPERSELASTPMLQKGGKSNF